MSRKVLALSVVGVFVAIFFGMLGWVGRQLLSQHQMHEASAAALGKPVAPFILKDASGREFRLPTPGRRVLINYWATWCNPCLKEMPVLQDFARRRLGSGGTDLVGIALDADAQGTRAWLASHPLDFPILLEAPGQADSSARLGNRLGVLPYSVLVGPDGRVLATRTGSFTSRANLEAWMATRR